MKMTYFLFFSCLFLSSLKANHIVQGALDVYWNMNGNRGSSGAYSPLKHDDISVGLATINFSGSSKRADYYLELVYGEQAAGTAAGTSAAQSRLAQAYLTHHFNDKVSFTAGRVDSNVGFEANLAKNNMNYSYSLGFNHAGPNFGEGIALRYKLSSQIETAVFLYDGPDQIDNNDRTDAYSFQFSYSSEKWKGVYNYFAEQDAANSSLHDLFLSYKINESFTASLNAILGALDEENLKGEWLSIAAYLKYKLASKAYLAMRLELWEQEDIALVGTNTDEEIVSLTLTYGFFVQDQSELKLEIRQDSAADNDIFADKDGAVTKDSQMNVSAAWIHSF